MKRLKISLTGHVLRWASRSFVLEVADDVRVETLDQRVLETLADDAQIGWEFGAEGFVQVTDHIIEEAGSEVDLPVITPADATSLIHEPVVPENLQSGQV